jgi:Cof subfamily protein (haloacid dehalogenase superfamily)
MECQSKIMFRAICTDIDGTLLGNNRELSPRTIHTFKQLPETVPVILASSRMPSAMRHLQQQLNISHHPLICYNGGYVLWYRQGGVKILDSVTIPPAIGFAILNCLRTSAVHMSIFHEDNWYAPQEDAWSLREERITKVTPAFGNLTRVLADLDTRKTGAHKIMLMGPEEEIQHLQEDLHARYNDALCIYRSKSTYLELAPKAVSKASALQLVLNELAISMHEAIAFGDNYNDIELLQCAGLGVAVGNARAEVSSIANEVTASNLDDGVAKTLEKYFSLLPA